jgi:hypothetical protein
MPNQPNIVTIKTNKGSLYVTRDVRGTKDVFEWVAIPHVAMGGHLLGG